MANTLSNMTSAEYQTFAAVNLRLADYTLDENLPAMPGPSTTQSCYTSRPSVNLGSLDKLPVELLQYIISLLDLSTLMDFRCVNRRSLQLVASLSQYEMITSHAIKVLQGALAIGFGKWITCEDLFTELCTAACRECGDFGGYLYLLTCTRVCYLCFTRNEKYLPLRHRHARMKFGLSLKTVSQLPRMRSLPGRFPPFGRRLDGGMILVDFCSAQAAGTPHLSIQNLPQSLDNEVFDRRCREPRRFMAVVRAPWFNRASGDIEWGWYCPACQKPSDTYNILPASRRMFPTAAFKDHLKVCDTSKAEKPELES